MPLILIKKHTEQMEAWRVEAKAKYKTKYEQVVSPYRNLLELYCKKKGNIGVTQAAIELAEHMPAQPKMVTRFGSKEKAARHLKAIFFSAALDLLDKRSEFSD